MGTPLTPDSARSQPEYFSESAAQHPSAPSLAELMGVSPEESSPEETTALRSQPTLVDPRLPFPGFLPAGETVRALPRRRGLAQVAIALTKLSLPVAILATLSFNYSEVRGASMMPGIHDRDRILVDHITYAFSSVDRGDVIVMRYPLDPRMDYIKRVVGLPGDDVVIQYGGVWVNGEPVEEPYVSVKSLDPYTTVHEVVKPGHYFVLGDNRIRSSDSREFGQVPQELVRGLVRLRVWPMDRFGWIH